MKFSSSKLLYAGIAFISLGVISLGVSLYDSHQASTRIKRSMNYTSTKTVQSPVQFSDVSTNSDMVVAEVKEYKSVIEIPSLGVVSQITDGVGSNMEYSVGHFPNTPQLGADGNICLAGHRSEIYDCIFNTLDKLTVGDTINIYDLSGNKQEYTVTKSRTVSPDSLGVLNDYGDNRLTIVTCTDKGTRRLIVTAKVLTDAEKIELLSGVHAKLLSSSVDTLKEFKTSIQEVINLTDFLDETRPYTHSEIVVRESVTYKYQYNIFRKLR